MAVLVEVFSDVDAIDGPVLDLVFSEGQLPFHSFRAILYGKLRLIELGVNLSEIEEGQGVVAINARLVKASCHVQRRFSVR